MANKMDEWIRQRIGSEAASAHRFELKRVKHDLRHDNEVLVDAAPVQVGRIGAELLVVTNQRLFTVSKSVHVPLGVVTGMTVGADEDDPLRFSLHIETPDKRIPLRVHGSYRDALLASLREVVLLDATPERARAFQERENQAKAETKEMKQTQVDDDARKSAYVALGASIVAYFFWEFHWVPLVAAGLAAIAWIPDEEGKRRSTAGMGVLVIASVVSAISLFLVGVDRGLIQ